MILMESVRTSALCRGSCPLHCLGCCLLLLLSGPDLLSHLPPPLLLLLPLRWGEFQQELIEVGVILQNVLKLGDITVHLNTQKKQHM